MGNTVSKLNGPTRKTIFAIRDTHSDTKGRRKAERILLAGGIDIFFIEWPRPIDRTNIPGSFAGLANDAEPSLRALATLAIRMGIPVVSCDLTPEDTVTKLNALGDEFGHYGLASAFQPWGKGIRDEHAAKVIASHMGNHPNPLCRGLVMFGTDHFKAEDGRNALPLHMLIKAKTTMDCYFV